MFGKTPSSFVSFKNRQVDLSKNVQVYKNLTKSTYSIRQNGIVVGHAKQLMLKNAEFIVNENGRQKVLKSGYKNVHAYVKGYLVESAMGLRYDDKESFTVKIRYNPYKNLKFMSEGLTNPEVMIYYCQFAKFDSHGVSGGNIHKRYFNASKETG